MSELSYVTVKGDHEVKQGIWRGVDDEARAYAAHAANNNDHKSDCLFCGAKDLLAFRNQLNGLVDISSLPPYSHFAGYKVARHELIIPDQHIEWLGELSDKQVQELLDHSRQSQAEAEEMGGNLTTYTRMKGSYAKSLRHLHTHGLTTTGAQVSQFDFSLRDGVTELEY